VTAAAAVTIAGCRDASSYGNTGDHYEGDVVQAGFVRTGIDDGTHLCLVLDANHLQDAPGVISSSDGRFHGTALRPIPQIWHDPLSTFTFGEGRERNLLYIATPTVDGSVGGNDSPRRVEADTMVIVSLMQGGSVEVRIVRGAPAIDAGTDGTSLFGVFALNRARGPCAF
jgi:hypothetical protein